MDAEAHRAQSPAQLFVHKMGNGINVNSDVMADVGPLEFPWLADLHGQHEYTTAGQLPIAHVRLNGNIAEPLQNWYTCPATTKTLQMMGGSEESARFGILHGLGKDPISTHLVALKAAAVHALNAGLYVILNPLHRRHRVDVTAETLRWVWGAVLEAFPAEDFPIDRVAFQMVHDPSVISEDAAHRIKDDSLFFGGVKQEDAGHWRDMMVSWAKQVHDAQPGRVLFVSALRANSSVSAHRATQQMLAPSNSLWPGDVDGHGTWVVSLDLAPFTDGDFSGTAAQSMAACTSGSVFCDPSVHLDPNLDLAQRALEGLKEQRLQHHHNEVYQVPLYVGSFHVLRSMPGGPEWLHQMRALLDGQGIHWAAPDFAGSRTALIAGKIDRYNATERLALWRSSKHAAAVFNFEPTQLPASFPALDRWVKGMVDQRFRFAPRSGCTCLADKEVRPMWAYHLSSVTADSKSGEMMRKNNRSVADVDADAEVASQVARRQRVASRVDVLKTKEDATQLKAFGRAPFPFDAVFVIATEQRKPRVNRAADALGLRVQIVDAILKPESDADWKKVAEANIFSHDALQKLSAGEVAIGLSHRKALTACIDADAEACLIFEEDFTAVGPLLRQRLLDAVAALPHDWNFLHLGRCWDGLCGQHEVVRVSPKADVYHEVNNGASCFHAYAVSRSGAKELIAVMPHLDGPVDHAHWQMATKDKKYFVSPAIFTQAPALRLETGSSSLATARDAAQHRLTVDNAFRPVIVPECSTEDAAFYPLSAAAPKLRATGAANAVEVSRLLRIAHKGVLAGLDACKLGRLSTALYADEPYLSTLQLQLDVHGCALQAALNENRTLSEIESSLEQSAKDDCNKTTTSLFASSGLQRLPVCPASRDSNTPWIRANTKWGAPDGTRANIWMGLTKMLQGAGYIRDLPAFARNSEVFVRAEERSHAPVDEQQIDEQQSMYDVLANADVRAGAAAAAAAAAPALEAAPPCEDAGQQYLTGRSAAEKETWCADRIQMPKWGCLATTEGQDWFVNGRPDPVWMLCKKTCGMCDVPDPDQPPALIPSPSPAPTPSPTPSPTPAPTPGPEALKALWAAQRKGPAASGSSRFTHVDFLGGFESPDWPKSPQCGNHPGLRQAPTARVRERGERLTKLVNRARQLEVRKVLKSGSMMVRELLDCLQPGEWEEVPQSAPTVRGSAVHALVRDPVDRLISTLGEVLRRALLNECPDGKCNQVRDGFDRAALATMEAQPWFEPASTLVSIAPNQTDAREYWLTRTMSAFLETTQCNLQYYGSEHSLSQTQQLISQGGGPGTPGSGNVVVHSLEELVSAQAAASSTFLQALGFTADDQPAVQGCFDSDQKFPKQLDHGKASETPLLALPPFLPSREELRRLLGSSKQLGLPMLATYGQDMLCLGYDTPPLWAEEIAAMGEKEMRLVKSYRGPR